MKKRSHLTVSQRLSILEDLKSLELPRIAEKHNIDISTVHRMRRTAVTLRKRIEEKQNRIMNKLMRKKKRVGKPRLIELEKRLAEWCNEKISLKQGLSDAIILRKAVELKSSSNVYPNFKGSISWIQAFKKRYRIKTKFGKHGMQTRLREIKNENMENSVEVKEDRLNDNEADRRCSEENTFEFVSTGVEDGSESFREEDMEEIYLRNRETFENAIATEEDILEIDFEATNHIDIDVKPTMTLQRIIRNPTITGEGSVEAREHELRHLFERLEHYVATEIPFVQDIFKVLKKYFVGD